MKLKDERTFLSPVPQKRTVEFDHLHKNSLFSCIQLRIISFFYHILQILYYSNKITNKKSLQNTLKMSTKADHYRGSKSSNQESFQALDEAHDKRSLQQHKSRPSQSSDFESINEKRMSDSQIVDKRTKNEDNFGQQLKTLQKLIISSEKSIEEQLQILKSEYLERQKQISSLKHQNSDLKMKCQESQEMMNHYREQYEKIDKKFKQQFNVSSSLGGKVSGLIQLGQRQKQQQKDFTKKNYSESPTENSNLTEMKALLKQRQIKIESLNTKIQLFLQEDSRIRIFLNKFLKFNPSFTMQLSTLVESAVIQLDCNLKEINRQLENMIVQFHLGNSNKILAKREKLQEEKYNHWETLSSLEAVKIYLDENYRNKF